MTDSIAQSASTRRALRRQRLSRARSMRLLYVVFAVPAALLIIFNYVPIYGLVIAFKDFNIGRGLLGSEWNNFAHFRMLWENPFFGRIFRNTVEISVLRVVAGFPAPILLALLVNEIGNGAFKRTLQSISYLPHFMSWVVLAGIVVEILSPQRGAVGYIYSLLGQSPPNLLTSSAFFRPMLVVTGIWKEVGWQAIIYLAALSTIDVELYEAAAVDGANRLQMATRITLPALVPIITILFILRLGNILDAGFDQIFNLYNPLVYEVADIIDTYVYRVGLIERRYDFSTAVGLFKNVIAVGLVVGSNFVIRRFSEYGIW